MQAKPSRIVLPAALAGALLASGCGASDDKFPPPCPTLSLLTDGDHITRFAGAGQDVTDMVLRARIVAVPAKCEAASTGKVRATMHIEASVTRGPAAKDASLQTDFFLALTKDGAVLKEQDFPLTTQFPSNVNQRDVKSDDIELLLPVSKAATAAAYKIYVGFRLTPEQLTYNRLHRLP
jgi:hypothetical protein